MIESIIFYAGFLLIVILFKEEFQKSLRWAWEALQAYPNLKPLAYPLAVLLAILVAMLIVNSIITLFTGIKYSYE
jgi:hypothetical protein